MSGPKREDRAAVPTAAEGARGPDQATVPQRPSSRELKSLAVAAGTEGTEGTEGTAGTELAAVEGVAPSAFDPLAERFQVVGELGRGGMGRVDEVFDRALGRPVALKHMLSASTVDLARFEREARITARLEHPGIVPIHDVGRNADGTPYYVMRRIDGQPLEELVEGKAFEERLALVPNVLAVCDAVAFAHARKVIHRDIKPTNILIGPFGETLLIDWGIARTLGDASEQASLPVSDPDLTRAGTVAGTPGFMAPEQARGETVDERVDVFALGATLFYVLAGKLPWAAATATAMIDHVGANRPPDWRRLPDETAPDLRAIVVKAMASDRDQRYADGGALAADLRRFVSGKLVGAHRYTRREQLRRFVRRNRAPLAVGAIAALVLAVVAVLFVKRLVSERDAANQARELAEIQRLDAVEKSDLMLVQHAQQLVEHDATAAIVALRRLPPESKQWDRAAIVAAAAAARGIPFGFSIESTVVLGLDLAPDSRRVAVSTRGERRLQVFDLVAHTREEFPDQPEQFHLRWIDDQWLIGADANKVVLFETRTRESRSFTLPRSASEIQTDRHGHAWVVSAGELYAIDPSLTTLPPPLATHVDSVRWMEDRLIVVREQQIEVHRGGLITLVPDSAHAENVVGDRELIAAARGKELCTWQLSPAPKLVSCRPAEARLPIALVEGTLYLFGSGGILEQGAAVGGPFRRTSDVHLAYPTPHGIVFDGPLLGIAGRDRQGAYSVGARPVSYSRLAETDDERFLVALSGNGELVIWDLSALRPRGAPIGAGVRLLGVTAHAIWSYETAGGVTRHDRVTGKSTLVFDARLTSAFIDPTERWIVGESQVDAGGTVTAHDLSTGKTVVFAATAQLAIDENGPILLREDGEAIRIEHGELGARLGRLPLEPGSFGARGGWLIAAYRDRLCRRSSPSSEVVCVPFAGRPDQIAIDERGVGWLLLGQAVWQWPVDRPPVEVKTPQVTRYIVRSGSTLFAVGASSIVILDAAPHPLAVVPMTEVTGGSTERAFGRTAQNKVVAIDLVRGLTYELLLLRAERMGFVGGADAVAFVAGQGGSDQVYFWPLTTPTEPVALRRWLQTVTNAKPMPDSDVVAWP